MREVSIKEVVIKIGDKKIALSLDEARELKDVLDRTLSGGEKTIFVPTAPVIIERPWYPNYPHWCVTCDSAPCGDATYTLTVSNAAGTP